MSNMRVISVKSIFLDEKRKEKKTNNDEGGVGEKKGRRKIRCECSNGGIIYTATPYNTFII